MNVVSVPFSIPKYAREAASGKSSVCQSMQEREVASGRFSVQEKSNQKGTENGKMVCDNEEGGFSSDW